jgi:hypothetical protein
LVDWVVEGSRGRRLKRGTVGLEVEGKTFEAEGSQERSGEEVERMEILAIVRFIRSVVMRG